MAELARTPKQLGNLIRRARKNQGLSQGELGAKTALTGYHIRNRGGARSQTREHS